MHPGFVTSLAWFALFGLAADGFANIPRADRPTPRRFASLGKQEGAWVASGASRSSTATARLEANGARLRPQQPVETREVEAVAGPGRLRGWMRAGRVQ